MEGAFHPFHLLINYGRTQESERAATNKVGISVVEAADGRALTDFLQTWQSWTN